MSTNADITANNMISYPGSSREAYYGVRIPEGYHGVSISNFIIPNLLSKFSNIEPFHCVDANGHIYDAVVLTKPVVTNINESINDMLEPIAKEIKKHTGIYNPPAVIEKITRLEHDTLVFIYDLESLQKRERQKLQDIQNLHEKSIDEEIDSLC